jgi:hypothetical protein
LKEIVDFEWKNNEERERTTAMNKERLQNDNKYNIIIDNFVVITQSQNIYQVKPWTA